MKLDVKKKKTIRSHGTRPNRLKSSGFFSLRRFQTQINCIGKQPPLMMRTPRQIFEINLTVICPIIRHLNQQVARLVLFFFFFRSRWVDCVSRRLVWTCVRSKHLRWRTNAYKTRSIKIVSSWKLHENGFNWFVVRNASHILSFIGAAIWPLVKANTIFEMSACARARSLLFMVPHSISKCGTSQWPNNTLSSNWNLVQIQFRLLSYRCVGIVVVIYLKNVMGWHWHIWAWAPSMDRHSQ